MPGLFSSPCRGHDADNLAGMFAEFVPLGFEVDRLADGRLQPCVTDAVAQQRTQFELVLLSQTEIERAVDRQAHAVTGLAKVLRHRRDEADAEPAVSGNQVARRTAPLHQAIDQAETLLQPLAY